VVSYDIKNVSLNFNGFLQNENNKHTRLPIAGQPKKKTIQGMCRKKKKKTLTVAQGCAALLANWKQ